MTGFKTTSMRHVGMSREATKETVLSKLAIGQQYRLKSTSATPDDAGKVVKCSLSELSRNVAVFLHKNGTRESFTYQELWTQILDGTFA